MPALALALLCVSALGYAPQGVLRLSTGARSPPRSTGRRLCGLRGGRDGGGLRAAAVGGATEPSVVPMPTRPPSDQTEAALGFFASQQTPAALVAGATLGVLFVFPLTAHDGVQVQLMKRAYILLTSFSFCNAIFSKISQAATVAARNLYLKTGCHYIYCDDLNLPQFSYVLAARAHFLTGLIAFAGALSIRMSLESSMGCPVFSRAMVSMVGSCVLLMLSLYNRSLVYFNNLGHVWVEYIKALSIKLFTETDSSGRQRLSFSPCAFAGLAFLALSLHDLGSNLHYILWMWGPSRV
ncbi:hypothetical protein T492DRAFT_970279 [Pavlovales sp. CCMP2436]|nr:hypothetical protein T492DRAFT_970279 [Pavlovales sp. CCMP2436]